MVQYSAPLGLDENWIYGLIRQESRFIMDARSSVGASGLMQLMPATARYVARKMNVPNFTPARVNELEMNLQLGTGYLKMVLDDLDGSPVLATAAYNAGPGGRARWRASLARPVEGRDLCRDHSVQRDPRLRQEGDVQQRLLRGAVGEQGAVAEDAAGRHRAEGRGHDRTAVARADALRASPRIGARSNAAPQ